MLALNYFHVALLLKVKSHVPKPELLHETQLNVNKGVFSFRETSHIQIAPKVSIRGGTCIKMNFVLLPIKGK